MGTGRLIGIRVQIKLLERRLQSFPFIHSVRQERKRIDQYRRIPIRSTIETPRQQGRN